MGPDFLRRMRWLGADRVRGYLWLFALLNTVMLGMLVATSRDGMDRNGFLLGSDFISFWTAGRMLASGAGVYDTAAHIAWQRGYFASASGYTAFFYPPVFLPFCRPLGLMGYFPALVLWLVSTGLVYAAAVRAWAREFALPSPLWLGLLAFPAVPIVITHGQTAFLLAGLLGLGLWLLPERPWMAGVLLGAAAIKPQFGVLVPFALVFTREWRAVLGACLSAGALAGVSTVAFGLQIWPAWAQASLHAKAAMEAGAVPFGKMTSGFAALRLLGMPDAPAYAIQGIASMALIALVIACCLKVGRFSPALAALVLAAAPLATPFVLDYDLVLLAFPLVWLTAQALATGWRDWEKLAVSLAFTGPAVARPLALGAGIPVMPALLALLIGVIVRRIALTPEPDARASSGTTSA